MLMPLGIAAQTATSASKRLNELGPENSRASQRVGMWNVTESVWESAGAERTTTTGLVAERRMVGSLLQEILQPASSSDLSGAKRIDLLTFNRVEGRWEYVSFDARAPVGLMSAWSADHDGGSTIDLTFAPFAIAGAGTSVTGQMLRMPQVITFEGTDRDVKQQYFTLADGTGTKWRAHRYVYTRVRQRQRIIHDSLAIVQTDLLGSWHLRRAIDGPIQAGGDDAVSTSHRL